MNPKIISDEPINMYDLNKELKKIRKREEEANIRSAKTGEYLKNFLVLKQGDADALRKELNELNVPRLKDVHVNKLVDILPETVDEVKLTLNKYNVSISKENYKKIVNSINKFRNTS
ncbi:hypothetical protein JW930_06830 [Candidatus Woesearchaeota archaeon]|nr:hypothetical protein [Candidatus Woesearchaeota archaeon]